MATERAECPNKEANESDCPCTSAGCERHGICCECIRYHIGDGGAPACMR